MAEIDAELPADASVWERDLLDHLTSHVRIERAMLETYVAASKASGSKALAYVVDLLSEDEKRHHMTFQALAATLVHDANFKPGDPEIPRLDFDRVDAPKVRGLSAELMAREVQDLVELRKLAKELPLVAVAAGLAVCARAKL